MEILNLEGTEDTPKIILDKKNGIFEISGRSLPEDSAEFYRPVLEWIEKYGEIQILPLNLYSSWSILIPPLPNLSWMFFPPLKTSKA